MIKTELTKKKVAGIPPGGMWLFDGPSSICAPRIRADASLIAWAIPACCGACGISCRCEEYASYKPQNKMA